MHATLRSEKGMALMMSLGAIVIIGVLMGGVLFVSTQDYRIGANTVRSTRAAAAAELGLNRVPVAWDLADNNRMQIGDTLKRAFTAPRGGTATVIITRLGGPFFWVVSEGYAGAMGSQASARRRYGTLFRLDLPQMNFLGAITTQGNTTVNGNVSVNGNDAAPAGWAARGGGEPHLSGRHAAHRRPAHRGGQRVPGQRDPGQLGRPESCRPGGGVRELLPDYSRAGRLEGHHRSRPGRPAGRRGLYGGRQLRVHGSRHRTKRAQDVRDRQQDHRRRDGGERRH